MPLKEGRRELLPLAGLAMSRPEALYPLANLRHDHARATPLMIAQTARQASSWGNVGNVGSMADRGGLLFRKQHESRRVMLINGKCHCGNISFTLDWPGESPDISARACGCGFCVKHGGVWTSKPGATLNVSVHDRTASSKYAFGTETATFHICSRCGAVPFVSSEIENRLYAVVNVNTFEGVPPSLLHRGDANFEGENVESRLSRRARNWIDIVHIREDEGLG